MRELDILLENYLDRRYDHAPEDEQLAFRKLLALPDPELYACLLKRQPPADKTLQKIIKRVTAP